MEVRVVVCDSYESLHIVPLSSQFHSDFYWLALTNTSLKQEPLLSPRVLLPLMLQLDPVTPASLVRTTVVAAEVDTALTTPTSANLLVVVPSSDPSSI